MRRINILVGAVITICAGLWGATDASADTLGQTYVYKVNSSYDAVGASTVQSTLRAIGTHGYFYVDDRYWNSLTSPQQLQFTSSLQTLSQDFDATIYPRSVGLWGGEANPGIDGDEHVVILFQRLINGSGGYFETIHNYSQQRAPASNAREMIFVSAESILNGAARTFVAHEFQHLISFQQRELLLDADDDVWLNESRSEYSVTVAGYSEPFEGSTLQRRAQSFMRNPSDSLTDWPNTSTDYSIASLFIHYLAERFGTAALVHTIHTTTAGAAALDEWLSGVAREQFGDVFTDWMVAVLLNDRSGNPAYGYLQSGLQSIRVRPMSVGQLSSATTSVSSVVTLKEWQPFWFSADISTDATSATEVSVHIDGASDVVWRGAVIASYRNGAVQVVPYESSAGVVRTRVPLLYGGYTLMAVRVAITHGRTQSVQDRVIDERTATVAIALGDEISEPAGTIARRPVDGDLIRRTGQQEVYVVWGPYRRYLTDGILALYGFQNRPVLEVDDATFFSYAASVYIRALDTKKVYAVWPDGTKHWLNISAAQWDASGRDWGAIFTVNDAEAAFYGTGADITR